MHPGGHKLSGEAAREFAAALDPFVEAQVERLEQVPPPLPESGQAKSAQNLKGVQAELGRRHFVPPQDGINAEEVTRAAELVLPSVWAMNKRRLKGEPLRFIPREVTKHNLNRVRPFLEQPLNDDAKEKGYRKARQIGLSENSVTETMWFADTHEHTKCFYTFPTNRQMQDFSNTRIAEAITDSDYLKSKMGDIKNVNLKKVGTSFIFLRGAQTERLGEGVDADAAFFDEIDRMSPRVKIAFKESLESSKWGLVREISTPTVPSYGIDEGWNKSKMWNWFIKCSRCNTRQTLEWLPNDDFGGRSSVILKEGIHVYACRNCEGELSLEDRMFGEWVAKHPGRELSYYQFSQLMAVWISAEKLYEKQEDYPFKQLFYNYALGLPYLGDNVLVTDEQIFASRSVTSRKNWNGPKVIGIDWGDRSWIVGLQSIPGNKIGLIYLKRIDSSDVGEIVTTAAEAKNEIKAELMVCDAGYGKDRNTLLLKKFPDQVYSCFYPNTEKGSKIFEPQWQDEQHKVSLDRTTSIKLSLGLFKSQHIVIAQEIDLADLKAFAKHLTNLVSVKDFDEKTGEIEEWIANTGPDHYGHAFNYAVTALSKLAKMPKGEFWDWESEVIEMKKQGKAGGDVNRSKEHALVPGIAPMSDLLEMTNGIGQIHPEKGACYGKKYNYDTSVCVNCTLQRSCKNITESSFGQLHS